ncbi:GCN5-related N-acetyltransferase [Methanosalsum zhilinae DSM 4017]|uniref:GCN5-related N-acetyltransferase n=1 Tax=Methanosalsum zhilinae (strain DSM 4017 / NBRC 107636 / OCM 62 / WeN5) TaxID=679901 RepID=F7XL75_METZD|nr:GNAT family N-acetyltransferase [Methanosalsum zhilinae]AEH60201.1 GCN5-related N-acetyltransferase [Methanosalsum zhilinae DSM 4017]
MKQKVSNNYDLIFRKGHESEFRDIYEFVPQCKPLGNYTMDFYRIMLRYNSDSCFVVEYDEEIVGWILSMVSLNRSDTCFLWQIGIKPSLQNHGIGNPFLRYAEDEFKNFGCSRVELTIGPENLRSQRFFEKNGYSNISETAGETIVINGNTAIKDYYRPDGHYMLYEKYL